MRKVLMVSLLSVSIGLAGCSNLGIDKSTQGTVLGGLGGVLIGSQIGGGNGKILAALIGAGAGAYLGNKIGGMLDERDQKALALRTQDVLDSPVVAAGAHTTWKSDHTGATAHITQGQAYEKAEVVEVKRTAKVQAAPSLKLIQAPYVTLKSSNVRAAPSANADKVGGLQAGTEFNAVGSTGDWILVGRKGVTVGYISKSLVAPKAVAVAKVKPSMNLDDISVASAETRGFDLDSVPTTSANIAASTTCKPVSVSVTSADGKSEKQDSTYCKKANGSWELI